ncbi:hypothetical protein DH2020_015969 [Rehmannia glutinosa]|uniref:Uncharacterized protein n=1 Tax=Rehmannia glutinosa TaxID=99300 RepID=A0ABR0WU53_REHGL
MASLQGILSSAILPRKKSRFCKSLQVRAQSYKDEGRPNNNIVDSNLHLLREKIEDIKNKERLERCFRVEPGWNYARAEISYKAKREKKLVEFVQLVGMAGGTLGLTILGCTFFLCIISLVLHLNQ